MNIYCPDGINENMLTIESDFFKLHEFYVPFISLSNKNDNIKMMTREMQEDPNPDFFEAILVNSQKSLMEYMKYEKTLLYFSPTENKLDHIHNFNRFDKIEGWFNLSEGEAIFNCINNSNVDGLNIEIGSWKGKSTSFMSYASKLKNNELICIDHFIGSPEHEDLKKNKQTTFTEFYNNLQHFDLFNNLTIIASTSEKAKKLINGNIKCLFIDGNHDQFNNDLQYYEHLLNSGSIVAFHDCGLRGQSKIADFMYNLADSGKYDFKGIFYSLGVLVKK